MKYKGNFGDMSPFDHGGLFVFEDEDCFEAIRVDNMFDSIGQKETVEDMDGNEESCWATNLFIYKSDIAEKEEELMEPFGGDHFEGEGRQLALACEAFYSGLADQDSSQVFHSHVALAKWILNSLPDDKDLQDEMYEYISPGETFRELQADHEQVLWDMSCLKNRVAHYLNKHGDEVKDFTILEDGFIADGEDVTFDELYDYYKGFEL